MDVSAPAERYLLSPMQEGMLFNTLLAPDSGVDLLLGVLDLAEALDEPRFEAAWAHVVAAHPALRTSFHWKGLEAPVGVVHEPGAVTLPIRRQDWSDVATDVQEQRWRELMVADRCEGFDLETAPLCRLTVVHLGPGRSRLLWPFHHALVDTHSMNTVLRQVFEAYDALGAGAQPAAIEPTVTQAAYSAWFAELDTDASEPLWREQLAGLQGPTRLGVDRGEPAGVAPGVHSLCKRVLDEQETAQLKAWVKEQGTSLNTVLQGAWALLLSRSSGQQRVVFGAVKSCRRSFTREADHMVGLVINTLPFALDVDGEQGFVPWLGRVREGWVALRDGEHTPLVSMKAWSGFGARLPLFESVLCFDPMEYSEGLEAGGGDWTRRRFDIFGQPDAPMVLNAYGGARLQLRITYDPRRFDEAGIEGLLDQFVTLLRNVQAAPELPMGQVSLLPEAERRRALGAWNDTDRALPDPATTLHELFAAQVARSPDAVALTMGEQTLRYAELATRARRLAHTLIARGVGPDDAVGLCCERSFDLVVGVLGILEAGAGYVPLDPAFPSARLEHMVAAADLSTIVTHGATRETVLGLSGLTAANVLCQDSGRATIDAASGEPPGVAADARGLAYILFTSGSTGRPKGVAMPHGPLVNLMRWQLGESARGPDACTLQFAPLGFDVSCQELFATLGSGGRLLLVDEALRRDTGALLEQLAAQQVTRLFLPFVALQQLVSVANERGVELPLLREVITAGEALQVGRGLVEFFARHPGCRLTNQYGPTECHVVTAHTLRGAPASWPALPPIGRPIANARAYVLDAHDEPVPVGMTGELCLGGACVSRGYLPGPDGDDPLTAARFQPDPFAASDGAARIYRTGDLARYRSDGEIEFLGRADTQVKLRGFRVELGEVETVLLEHPAVRQVVLRVREVAAGDQRLTAWVVPAEGEAPTPSDLRGFLKDRLAPYMLPSDVVLLDAVPLSPNGKVDERALPAPQDRQLADEPVAPTSETERALVELWQELLHVERVGVHDDFFELGGHSILAMQVLSRVRDRFDVDVPLARMFDDATIAGLGEHIDTLAWAKAGAAGCDAADGSDTPDDDQEDFEL